MSLIRKSSFKKVSPFKQTEEQTTESGPLGAVSSFLGSAGTPIGIAMSLGSSIFGAIKAKKEERRARRKMSISSLVLGLTKRSSLQLLDAAICAECLISKIT